jgi:hypothetical protein
LARENIDDRNATNVLKRTFPAILFNISVFLKTGPAGPKKTSGFSYENVGKTEDLPHFRCFSRLPFGGTAAGPGNLTWALERERILTANLG